MIPTQRTLVAIFLLLVLSVGTLFIPEKSYLWMAAFLLFHLGLILDAVLGYTKPDLSLIRTVNHALPLGVVTRVELRVENKEKRKSVLEIYDFLPEAFACRDLPLKMTIGPRQWTVQHYEVRPIQRGEFSFEPAQVRVRSPFGFWFRSIRLGEPTKVRIFPNFKEASHLNLLASNQHLNQLGIRKKRKRGEGMDFHQLREYVAGDALRQIDWKASSRMRKLISREYQEERDQQLYFLLDCGMTMRAKDGALSHFDHALNAVLLLAKVALGQGDAVGLATFAGHDRWLAPRKGVHQLNSLLNRSFDLQPTTDTADYLDLARAFSTKIKKRALVIFFTNLRDEDSAEMTAALALLKRRHLVLIASMRERVLDKTMENPIYGFNEALMYGALHEYLQSRAMAISGLRRQGAFCLDVRPDELAVASINAYLEIKSRNIL